MIDFGAFLGGVAGNIASRRVEKPVDETIDELTGNTVTTRLAEDYLHEIHLLLVELVVYYKLKTQGDLYTFITLYKSGFGPAYTPIHKSSRQHFTLFTPTSVVLNCYGSGLGAFNLTTKAADWTLLDFPESSAYLLDTTAPNNSMVAWLRETNADVV